MIVMAMTIPMMMIMMIVVMIREKLGRHGGFGTMILIAIMIIITTIDLF
jgi:hypothetical protein